MSALGVVELDRTAGHEVAAGVGVRLRVEAEGPHQVRGGGGGGARRQVLVLAQLHRLRGHGALGQRDTVGHHLVTRV